MMTYIHVSPEEKKWVHREESLRSELREARDALAALEAGAGAGAGAGGGAQAGAAPVLEQLAQLQHQALQRDLKHAHATRQLQAQLSTYTHTHALIRTTNCTVLCVRIMYVCEFLAT